LSIHHRKDAGGDTGLTAVITFFASGERTGWAVSSDPLAVVSL